MLCTSNAATAATADRSRAETLLIATVLTSPEAETIALIHQYRWTVEIFFRFYKHILGCRHLLSNNRNGIELQTYAALMACLLITLWTGRQPTLRTFEMPCWHFTGMVDTEELPTSSVCKKTS